MSTLQVGSYSHIIKPENVESVNTMVDAALLISSQSKKK